MASAKEQAREQALQKWTNILYSVEDDFKLAASKTKTPLSFDTEVRFALAALVDGPSAEYMQKCSIESILNALTNVAVVGLTINPAMKLAYLVPRDGKVVLDISYIGLIKLATDTGSILAAKAELVYENDLFEYKGPFEKPVHKLNPFKRAERGELVGVYIIAKLHTGFDQIDTLDMEEINKIRDKSKAKSGPWKDWFEEMVKKTGIKRAAKLWPRTEQLSMAEDILNEHEGIATPINAGRGADAARAAQEQERVDVGDLEAVKATLMTEAHKGTEAYKAAWQAITKEQRKALVNEHATYKNIAAQADENQQPEEAQS